MQTINAAQPGVNKTLELSQITKRFDSTVALNRVSLKAYQGEVHGLIGQNGSGKSTLMKILAGVYAPDEGKVLINDREVDVSSVERAESLGIGIVFQELSLFSLLSVSANIMIGREPRNGPLIDRKRTGAAAAAVLGELGIGHIPLDEPVGQLTTAEQQLIEIAKCLVKRPSVIIFDEPTAALTVSETQALFRVVSNLKKQNLTILFISHHLEEIFEIGDRVSVLRDGEVVYSDTVDNTSETELVQHMVGRKIDQFYPVRTGVIRDKVVLELDQVRADGLQSTTLSIKAGEIVGIGGPIGSGQSRLAETIAGIRPLKGGILRVNGKPARLRGPSDAIAAGIAYVPEDRRTEGLLLNLSIRANVTLPLLTTRDGELADVFGFIRRAREVRHTSHYRDRLKIKTGSVNAVVSTLSGGTQQKVAVARWLGMDASVYVFNDPTKGIDVGSKVDIYEVINQLADEGKAVILVSSYNPELLGMCSRIVVMFKGRIVKEFAADAATEEQLLLSASATE